MSSFNSTGYKPFSACDDLAAHYEKLQIPPSTFRTTPFGCKAYRWPVERDLVTCTVGVTTLGYGLLTVKPKMDTSVSFPHVFSKGEVVKGNHTKIVLSGPFNRENREVLLPEPSKK